MNPVEAERCRRRRILGDIVDEHCGLGRHAVALEQNAKDTSIGFDDALPSGDHDAVKPRQEGEALALLRKGLRKTDFIIGSELVINGFRAKNGTPSASGRTVKFNDGRNFFMGSTGTGAPDDGPGDK